MYSQINTRPPDAPWCQPGGGRALPNRGVALVEKLGPPQFSTSSTLQQRWGVDTGASHDTTTTSPPVSSGPSKDWRSLWTRGSGNSMPVVEGQPKLKQGVLIAAGACEKSLVEAVAAQAVSSKARPSKALRWYVQARLLPLHRTTLVTTPAHLEPTAPRLIIYHYGMPRVLFIGALKLTTVFVFGFFVAVVIPSCAQADVPTWQVAGCKCPSIINKSLSRRRPLHSRLSQWSSPAPFHSWPSGT